MHKAVDIGIGGAWSGSAGKEEGVYTSNVLMEGQMSLQEAQEALKALVGDEYDVRYRRVTDRVKRRIEESKKAGWIFDSDDIEDWLEQMTWAAVSDCKSEREKRGF